MRFQSISSMAREPFRGRHNASQVVTKALVVLAETEKAIRCSVDGAKQIGQRDGWLNKKQIIIHEGSEQPFVVVSLPSWMLVQKKLTASQFELDGEGWSAEQRLAFQWAKTWAHKIQQSSRKRSGATGNLTTFGRAEYL